MPRRYRTGKMHLGSGLANKETRVLLPQFLNDFADYQVDMDVANTMAYNNVRWFSLLLRTDVTETDGVVKLNDAYNTLGAPRHNDSRRSGDLRHCRRQQQECEGRLSLQYWVNRPGTAGRRKATLCT